jgi:hypothetical protein
MGLEFQKMDFKTTSDLTGQRAIASAIRRTQQLQRTADLLTAIDRHGADMRLSAVTAGLEALPA